MSYIFSSVMGTVFYSIVVFSAGAFIGRDMFNWTVKYLPWKKN
jgi:hypothetical protein